MKFLFLLLLVSQVLYAADPFELTDEEKDPETEEILIKRPEKYLRHDSMIYDLNTDIGIKDQRKYTGTDSNRIGLAGNISADYEHLSDMLGLEFNYMHRSSKYNQMWYGFQLFQQSAKFDAITQNQEAEAGDDINDESQYQRPDGTKTSVFGLGLGLGYRFKLLMEFFPTEDVFENIDVYANFLTMNEKFINRKYSGYGLTTNYGIHKRSSTNFFYGGKLSYNLASVTRKPIGEEAKRDRSLTLGWLSMGLEIGFFF